MTQPLFVTDDPIRWGNIGVGPLDDFQVDQNFWGLHVRVAALEGLDIGLGLSGVSIPFGNTLRFTFSDHSHQDVLIPFLYPRPRGAWAPGPTTYAAFDYFSFNGRSYLVLYPHVADATFDADRAIGGNQLYGLLLDVPTMVIPDGGDVPAFLGKNSATDFDLAWIIPTFALLGDVALNSDLAPGDAPVWNGAAWVNQPLGALSPPSSGTLGGVMGADAEAHKFVTIIDDAGIQQLAQPDYDDLSGAHPSTKYQGVGSVAGVLTIDLSQGWNIEPFLTENVTSIVLTNYPNVGGFIDLKFIFNQVAGTFAYTVTGWPGGSFSFDGNDPAIATGSGKRTLVTARGLDDSSYLLVDLVTSGYISI